MDGTGDAPFEIIIASGKQTRNLDCLSAAAADAFMCPADIGQLSGSHPNRLHWLTFKSALTQAIPDWLKPEFDGIATAGFGTYNAVLINLYSEGKYNVDPHSDDDYGDPTPTIPRLVLGECRPFYLARIVERRGSKVILDPESKVKYMPGHGDLLVMKGRTNADWQHWIPKTKKKIGERLSLTFRFKETK